MTAVKFGDKELIKKINQYSKPIMIEHDHVSHCCPNCDEFTRVPNKYTLQGEDYCDCCGQVIEGGDQIINKDSKFPAEIKCRGCTNKFVITMDHEGQLYIQWFSKYGKK